MEKRTRQLVAWTDNGRIRMIPSLIRQFAQPHIERIAEIESNRPNSFKEQPRYLIDLSRAYESLGNYYERFGYIREAFDAYVEAAISVTRADDYWWCDCDEGFFLSKPLQGRFFEMYVYCRRLFRMCPALKDSIAFESLMYEYKLLTAVTDIWHSEFVEAMETSRAWRFGA